MKMNIISKHEKNNNNNLANLSKDHTYVICAYKEEKNIEECILSLLNQTLKSKIIISTSTPNKFLTNIAKKYDIELRINKEKSNHLHDFWFAYNQANTKFITLCHQDDIYFPKYGEKVIKKLLKSKKPIIAFTNYYEIRNGKIVKNNLLLFVKRLINMPLLFFKNSKRIRKFTLSIGNAICCPSVSYNKEIVELPLIDTKYVSNLDWISYIEFSKYDGQFIYLSKPLVGHRIHENSTTSNVIANNTKSKEDFEIFKMFWPKSIAKLLLKLYGGSEKSNNLKRGE